MTVQTQSFSSFVSNAVTAIQGAAQQLLDLAVGSVLRAFVEAVAGVALWLQGMALQIASLTRFATSSGTDADSWAADFGFTRLPAQSASGPVTFARFTPSQQASIQAATSNGTDANGNTIWAGGFLIQTADGSQQYQAIPDTTQTAYSSSLNAYVLPAGVASIIATVQSLTASTAANAGVGAINTLGAAISGVDTVANAQAFTNGANAESDQAFKIRFVGYLASLAKATPAAIKNAIASIQQDLSYSLTENQAYPGGSELGYFYAVVDDGSGAPPSSLISSVSNAIDAVRPIGSVYGVFAPIDLTANITLSLKIAAGYSGAALQAAVQNALSAYVESLGVGQSLPFTKIAQLAYDTSPGITNVTGILLNGSTADISASAKQVINPGAITVNLS